MPGQSLRTIIINDPWRGLLPLASCVALVVLVSFAALSASDNIYAIT